MSAEESPAPELAGLPEARHESLFAESGARIILPSERKRHVRVTMVAVVLVLTALLGLWNGYDYVNGDIGLIDHRKFINRDAELAAPGTAVLIGRVLLEDGTPAANYTVKVTVKSENNTVREQENVTDDDGRFRIEGLDPGIQVLMIANNSRQGSAQLVQHLVLLNPPPKYTFEPYGFTTLTLIFPSDETFAAESEDGSYINYVPMEAETDTMLYDESAAGVYIMVGVGFSGLALIGLVATWIGWRDSSAGMLRTAAVLCFFTQGPIGTACCTGLIAGLMTVALPKGPGDP